MRRLQRDHPLLYQRVLAGELSANAAAIEARWEPLRLPNGADLPVRRPRALGSVG